MRNLFSYRSSKGTARHSGAKALLALTLSAGLIGPNVGCETKAGTGALLGGAGGAGLGAIIGHNSHGRTAEGALIGGAVGAIGGALVGNELDKNDRRQERDVDRAYHDGVADGRTGGRPAYVETRTETRVIRPAPGPVPPLTQEDVIAMSNRGIREPELLDRIDRSGTVFRLSAGDENRLRDNGVSENVIREMKATERR